MKIPLEIPVYMIQRGAARAIVALGLNDEVPALEFLTDLHASNPKGFQILVGQMKFLAEAPTIRNKQNFKELDASRRLFEFHPRTGLRLYCFVDGDQLIVLTNGGKKGKKREQTRDIEQAKRRQDDYLRLKREGSSVRIIEHDF